LIGNFFLLETTLVTHFVICELQYSVSVNGCQDTVPSISAKTGVYVEGSISPATLDVYIKIVAAGKSNYAQLKEGDVASETKTNSEGSFIAGPLYDDIEYKVEASKVRTIF
jgi:hypothetical protein